MGRTTALLELPHAWQVPLSPHAAAMQRSTEAWFRERGVIHDHLTATKFERLAVAEYACWPFPTANAERSEVITKFLALWIFYDDALEEDDDGMRAQIHDAIAGRPAVCPIGGPHLRCWWELGQAYAQCMSAAWVERHARLFTAWVDAVREESVAAAEFRATGSPPSASAHLERRRINIGMLPNIDFIEYQLERELPCALLEDPDVVQLSSVASEVVGIVNDLFGYAKDQHNRWPNLVSCVRDERGISLERAFIHVVAMLNRRIRSITALERRLFERLGDDALLVAWVQGLRHVMYGFTRWHAMASRYSAVHELEDGRTLELVLRLV